MTIEQQLAEQTARANRLERELAAAMSKLKDIWNVSPGQYVEELDDDNAATYDCEQCNEMIRIAESTIDCEIGDKLLAVEDAARTVACGIDYIEWTKKAAVDVDVWKIERLIDALKAYDAEREKNEADVG